MRLKLTPSLRNEWDVRSIEGVIPALAQVHWRGASDIEVDANLAADIAADCKFYINPKAVDATAAERSIYRALLRQIEAAVCDAVWDTEDGNMGDKVERCRSCGTYKGNPCRKLRAFTQPKE